LCIQAGHKRNFRATINGKKEWMSILMLIQPTFPLFSFRTNHRLLQSFAFARFLNKKPLAEKTCTRYVINPRERLKTQNSSAYG
jgi:hypothetical protein